MEIVEAPEMGMRVRVRRTGATGLVVEVSRRHQTADVDLGDDIIAEFGWDEIEAVKEEAAGG